MSSAAPVSADPAGAPTTSGLDRWFEISRRGSTVSREVRGGLVTFFAMAYIFALNPLIIGTAADSRGLLISGLPKLDAAGQPIAANVSGSIAMVAAATALIAGIMTILMGVVGRYPLGLAAGLGINAMLAYIVAPKVTWPQAMGLIVWEGIAITILVLTGFREAVFKAVPRPLRTGISIGIGLFIAFVGLVDAGVIRRGSGTLVELGIGGSLTGWPIGIFVVGLIVLVLLFAARVRGAMLISIVAMTLVSVIVEGVFHLGPQAEGANPTGWALNVPALPATGGILSAPDFGIIGRVDMLGAFSGGPDVVVAMVMTIFALLLADFFDTMGTIVAVGAEGNLLDADGNPPHTREVLLVDSLAALGGGLGSASSNTSFIESAAGVGEGARTGLASVVTGLAFIATLFLSPLVNMVPSEAVAPVLVFVGFLMMEQVGTIDWTNVEEGIPVFLTSILMPLTYSITNGIGAGLVFFVLIKAVRGKAKEIHPLMWAVAVAFVLYFSQALITSLF
ncbi:NCS2 family permease [Nigerium massiliense]|uniref:NCS2 family permease n=1 Tax=Nigerium massiliense TaxID=1522317 RepID=UPI00058C131B|nr:NCS2 family permease [Nigerium massiliense]